jgi:hypothetical protein
MGIKLCNESLGATLRVIIPDAPGNISSSLRIADIDGLRTVQVKELMTIKTPIHL